MKLNLILLFTTLFLSSSLNGQVCINEIMASNISTVADNFGDFDDWIEVYNPTSSDINLAGYYFTDDLAVPNKYKIPSTNSSQTTVPAFGYTLFWADNELTEGAHHVGFKFSSGGEDAYLYAPDGISLIDGFTYPAVGTDLSYGRVSDCGTQLQIFTNPTPNDSNNNPIDVQITFSQDCKFFSGSLSVALSTTANNGDLRYSTDNSEPTSSSPLYTGPMTINNTVELKAKFFFTSGTSSLTKSARYVKFSSNISAANSNIPIVLIDSYNSEITDIDLQKSLVSIIEPPSGGRAYASSTPNHLGKAGLKVTGNSSASFDKKSFRMETWDAFENDLDASLIGMPEESDWVLYAPGEYDRALINNALAYGIYNEFGRYAPRTQFVEVYYNEDGNELSPSDYWGVYILTESIKRGKDRIDVADLTTQDNSGVELTGGYIYALDREKDITTPYTNIYYCGNPGGCATDGGIVLNDPEQTEITSQQFSYIQNYILNFEFALTGNNWLDPITGYKTYINENSWIDQHILRGLSKEVDGFTFSTFFTKDKSDLIDAGPPWDFDRSFNSIDSRDDDPTGWFVGQNLNYWGGGVWIQDMVDDPEYKTLWVDRWFDLRKSGILNTTNMNSYIDNLAALVTESSNRELNRWNRAYRYGGFAGEISAMKTWLENRSVWIDNYFIGPVSFSPNGGQVTMGQSISILNTNGGAGTIYYTTDGTDPRLEGGATSSTAIAYSGGVIINDKGITKVTARIKNGSEWGAVCSVDFYVTEDYSNLRINEIHYHPADVGLTSGDKLEFLEIFNNGSDAVNLTGVYFEEGIDFSFASNTTIAGYGYAVVAKNATEFTNFYGIAPTGDFKGNLNNSGDTIWMNHPFNNQVLDEVIYDDFAPWEIQADGMGPSLGLSDPNSDNNIASNWCIQSVDYTPFTGNQCGLAGGSILGVLFLDVNGNGIFDSGEIAIPNVNIIINQSDGSSVSTTTNSNGSFSAAVVTGSASIIVDTTDPNFPHGATSTNLGNPIIVNISSGNTVNLGNIGYHRNITIDTDVFLQGGLLSGGGGFTYGSEMRTGLNGLRVLPGQLHQDLFFGNTYWPPGQPYDVEPWLYFGDEGDQFDSANNPANASAGYPLDAVDWVLVSLRTGTQTNTTVCKAAALLYKDGSINFVQNFECNDQLDNNFYIVVEHRNHLIIMSPSPLAVDINAKVSFDFRNADGFTGSFGLGTGQTQITNINGQSYFAMMAGNPDQQLTTSSDTDINVNDKIIWDTENNQIATYSYADHDLSGDVNVNDKTVWSENNSTFSSVPRD